MPLINYSIDFTTSTMTIIIGTRHFSPSFTHHVATVSCVQLRLHLSRRFSSKEERHTQLSIPHHRRIWKAVGNKPQNESLQLPITALPYFPLLRTRKIRPENAPSWSVGYCTCEERYFLAAQFLWPDLHASMHRRGKMCFGNRNISR